MKSPRSTLTRRISAPARDNQPGTIPLFHRLVVLGHCGPLAIVKPVYCLDSFDSPFLFALLCIVYFLEVIFFIGLSDTKVLKL